MNHKKLLLFAFAAGLAISATPSMAAGELSPLIVSAGRTAEDPSRVSASVTVIDEEEIRKSQAETVAELLRHQAGISIVSAGGPGKATSLFLRGGNNGHTLVLIDGVRVGSATLGAFDWGLMSAEDIERIEIVRGPQSSLYGADAMSGVIQIFTKKGKGVGKVRIGAEIGGLASSSGHMQISGTTEDNVGYALTAAGQRTDGVSVAANGTEPDPFRQTQLSGSVQAPVGDGTFELLARQSEGVTALDGGFPFGDVLNWNTFSRQTVYSGKLSYPLADNWESSVQLSRSFDDMLGYDPANVLNNADIHTRIDQVTWQNHFEWSAVSTLLGFDYHADRAVNRLAPINTELRQSAGFVSLAYHAELIDVNASARYDRNSTFGNKATWHAGTALHPLDGLKISANYGTGFKAPSVNDLYWPGSGNPNLKPETSNGWDVGMDYRWSGDALKAGCSVSWFDQRYQGLIAWAPIAPGSFIWAPANVNKAHNRGAELAMELSYAGMYLKASWNYLLARDAANDTWLARRPKESGNLLLGADIAAFSFEGNLAIVGPRFSSPNNVSYMQGYRKIDVRGRYRINKTWKITARVDNVGNKRYEEASGYGVPGRVWHTGLEAGF